MDTEVPGNAWATLSSAAAESDTATRLIMKVFLPDEMQAVYGTQEKVRSERSSLWKVQVGVLRISCRPASGPRRSLGSDEVALGVTLDENGVAFIGARIEKVYQGCKRAGAAKSRLVLLP